MGFIILVAAVLYGYRYYQRTIAEQTARSELIKADRYLQSGDFEKAVKSYRKVISLTGKEDLAILKKLVVAEIGLKNRDEAERLLKQIVARDPKDAESLFQLALIYYEKRETTKAIEIAEKAASYRVSYVAPRFFLARQYMILGNYKRAAIKLNEIVKNNPETVKLQPEILKDLAFCYEKLNQKEIAIYYYQQALSFFPGDADIYSALKRLNRK
jgi:tetratricopeptide (TPR) repeat protein